MIVVLWGFGFSSEVHSSGTRMLQDACGALISGDQAGACTAVLNTLGWKRTEVVPLTENITPPKLGTVRKHQYYDSLIFGRCINIMVITYYVNSLNGTFW